MSMLSDFMKRFVTKEIVLEYLKDQAGQMADYLTKKKKYPHDLDTVKKDILAALEYALNHGDVVDEEN